MSATEWIASDNIDWEPVAKNAPNLATEMRKLPRMADKTAFCEVQGEGIEVFVEIGFWGNGRVLKICHFLFSSSFWGTWEKFQRLIVLQVFWGFEVFIVP